MAVATPTEIGPLLAQIVKSVDDVRRRLDSLPPDAPQATRDQLGAVLAELRALEQSAEDLFDRMEAAEALNSDEDIVPWEEFEADLGAA